jgi:hypothetical protein
LTFVIVAGYYTDADVRERIGYPGQQRIVPDPRAREPWDEEGLTAEVLARGPVYKDPVTGQRAARKEPSRPHPRRPVGWSHSLRIGDRARARRSMSESRPAASTCSQWRSPRQAT